MGSPRRAVDGDRRDGREESGRVRPHRLRAQDLAPAPRAAAGPPPGRPGRMTRPSSDRGAPTFGEIEAARRLLAPLLEPTPLIGAPGLSRLAGREVRLKAENLQLAGSFKIRGAYNRI